MMTLLFDCALVARHRRNIQRHPFGQIGNGILMHQNLLCKTAQIAELLDDLAILTGSRGARRIAAFIVSLLVDYFRQLPMRAQAAPVFRAPIALGGCPSDGHRA